jgi:hypothetical protein
MPMETAVLEHDLSPVGQTGAAPDQCEARAGACAKALGVCGRILIVEDELWSALDMEWVVGKTGREVVGVAASAEHSIKLAEATRPDLVLMGSMPPLRFYSALALRACL